MARSTDNKIYDLIYKLRSQPDLYLDPSKLDDLYYDIGDRLQELEQDSSFKAQQKAYLIKELLLTPYFNNSKPALSTFTARKAHNLLLKLEPLTVNYLFDLKPEFFLNPVNSRLFFSVANKIEVEQFISNLNNNEDNLINLIKLEKKLRKNDDYHLLDIRRHYPLVEALQHTANKFKPVSLDNLISEGPDTDVITIILHELFEQDSRRLFDILDKQRNTILHRLASYLPSDATSLAIGHILSSDNPFPYISTPNFANDNFLTLLLSNIDNTEVFITLTEPLNNLLNKLSSTQLRQLLQTVNTQGKTFVNILTDQYRELSPYENPISDEAGYEDPFSDKVGANYKNLMETIIQKIKGQTPEDYANFIKDNAQLWPIVLQNLPIKPTQQALISNALLNQLFYWDKDNTAYDQIIPAFRTAFACPAFRYFEDPRPLLRHLLPILHSELLETIIYYNKDELDDFYNHCFNGSEGLLIRVGRGNILDAVPEIIEHCFSSKEYVDDLIEQCQRQKVNFLRLCYHTNNQTFKAIENKYWRGLDDHQKYRLLTDPDMGRYFERSFIFYLLDHTSNNTDDRHIQTINRLLPIQANLALNAIAHWFNQPRHNTRPQNPNIYENIVLPLLVDNATAIQLDDLSYDAQFWLKMPPAKRALKEVLEKYRNPASLDEKDRARINTMVELANPLSSHYGPNLFQNIVNHHERDINSLFEPQDTNTRETIIRIKEQLDKFQQNIRQQNRQGEGVELTNFSPNFKQ